MGPEYFSLHKADGDFFFKQNSDLCFCLCAFCIRHEGKINFYFVLLWNPAILTNMGGGNHLISPNIITRYTTKALAISTLCRKALKKTNRHSIILRILLLFRWWSLQPQRHLWCGIRKIIFAEMQRVQRVEGSVLGFKTYGIILFFAHMFFKQSLQEYCSSELFFFPFIWY